MARMPSIPNDLNKLFTPKWIRKTARACGAMKRAVKVDIVVLFWTLMLAPQGGAFTTLAVDSPASGRARVSWVSARSGRRSGGVLSFGR